MTCTVRPHERSSATPASVRAVFCTRGGYGAQRFVDLVDWDSLRGAEPKVLVGFSDATTLHQAVASRLGVVTLHGPMIGGERFLASSSAKERLRATLFAPESQQVLERAGAHPLVGAAASGNGWGTVAGVTTGGCLALLATGVGTPHSLPGARGGLLLLEDVDRPVPAVDMLLTQLRRTGWLDGAAGVALGSWEGCGPTTTVEAVVTAALAPLGLPTVGELGFGHGPDPLTVALGVEAELDVERARLELATPPLAPR